MSTALTRGPGSGPNKFTPDEKIRWLAAVLIRLGNGETQHTAVHAVAATAPEAPSQSSLVRWLRDPAAVRRARTYLRKSETAPTAPNGSVAPPELRECDQEPEPHHVQLVPARARAYDRIYPDQAEPLLTTSVKAARAFVGLRAEALIAASAEAPLEEPQELYDELYEACAYLATL